MSTLPLVSVIVPAYNAASYIDQTLDSVRAQTYEELEIVVVDDGSQDDTARIVRSRMQQDNRIQLLDQPNRGVAAARNAAIEASSGEYIAPIDADDIWHPKKIERQVRCMQEAGSSVGLVYTWWSGIDHEGNITCTSHPWLVEGMVHEALVSLCFIGNASVPLFRRTAVKQAGMYSAELRAAGGEGCEDWDLALRIVADYHVRVVPAYLVGYRQVRDSMSGNGSAMSKSYELVMERVRRRRPELPDKIFEWSKSHFYRHLAGVCYRNGRYRQMATWLHRSLTAGPTTIWSPWRARLLIERLPEPADRLVRALWSRRHPSERRQDPGPAAETSGLPELGEQATSGDLSQLLQSI